MNVNCTTAATRFTFITLVMTECDDSFVMIWFNRSRFIYSVKLYLINTEMIVMWLLKIHRLWISCEIEKNKFI